MFLIFETKVIFIKNTQQKTILNFYYCFGGKIWVKILRNNSVFYAENRGHYCKLLFSPKKL